MKTRVYSQGRNDVLGERWFTTAYSVPIFSQGAILRWIKAKANVTDHSGQKPYRILRIRTLSQMEILNGQHC